MTLLDAIAALPCRLLLWTEMVSGDGTIDIRVTCQTPDQTQIHVRQTVPGADLRVGGEPLLRRTRAAIVETLHQRQPDVA